MIDDDNFAPFVESGEDIEDFREDESRKGDGDNWSEWAFEEPKSQKHDDGPLVDTGPDPSEEGFEAEFSALLQTLVELGILQSFSQSDVFIEYQA